MPEQAIGVNGRHLPLILGAEHIFSLCNRTLERAVAATHGAGRPARFS